MSTEAASIAKTSEPLFSKKNRKLLSDPLNENNPITIQVLGICSALAITGTLATSLVMTICVVFVTAFANLTISLLRNQIPGRIRMIVQLVVIASLVTIVSEVLAAFAYDLSKQLSVFVGLIITNCIIMGRLEAFAMANKPWQSFLDGVGNGLGYGIILIGIALVREPLGTGTIFGYPIFEKMGVYSTGYVDNGLMIYPIASIFVIGVFIWIQRAWKPALVDIS